MLVQRIWPKIGLNHGVKAIFFPRTLPRKPRITYEEKAANQETSTKSLENILSLATIA